MEWYVLVLISAFFLAAYDIIRKRILKREHSLELLAVSFLTAFVLQLFLIPFINFSIPWFTLFIIFVRSMIVATGLLFLTRALHHMEISSVLPLKNLTPLFLIFLSVIFLGETVRFLQIIGIFLIVAGSYFLQIHEHYFDFFRHVKEFRNKYIYYALGSAALFSIAAMLSKVVLTDIEPLTYMFYSNTFIAGYFAVSLFTHYGGWSDIIHGFKVIKWWIPILGVLGILTDLTYYSAIAIPGVMIALVVPIRRLAVLFTTVAGGRLFHEHYLFHKIVSTIILLVGAVLIVLG